MNKSSQKYVESKGSIRNKERKKKFANLEMILPGERKKVVVERREKREERRVC